MKNRIRFFLTVVLVVASFSSMALVYAAEMPPEANQTKNVKPLAKANSCHTKYIELQAGVARRQIPCKLAQDFYRASGCGLLLVCWTHQL